MKIPYKFNRFGKSDQGSLNKGLDFYLPFDDNWNDVVHGISGDIWYQDSYKVGGNYYSIITDLTSTIGNCLKCAKDSGRYNLAYIGTESMCQYGTEDFSVSFWMQTPKWIDEVKSPIFSKYNKVGGIRYGFSIYSDGNRKPKLNMRIYQENRFFTESDAQNTQWVHWCFVRKNTVGYWYRNGVLDATDTSGACSSNANSTDAIRIGWSKEWYAGGIFYGKFKSYRLYNRALSDKEILQLSEEFANIKYFVDVDPQSFQFTPGEDKTYSVDYNCAAPTTCLIISGLLPNTITFNSNTCQFTGKSPANGGLFNVVLRFSGDNIVTNDVNITLDCKATSNLNIPTPQSLNFLTLKAESKPLIINKENDERISGQVLSGMLPTGCSLTVDGTAGYINSDGSGDQQSTSAIIGINSNYHILYVTGLVAVDLIRNRIIVPDKNIRVYTEDGSKSFNVNYSTETPITPIYTLIGQLPNGFTFDSTNGILTYDGVYSAPTTKAVDIQVGSSTGHSITDTGTFNILIVTGSCEVPSGVWLYCPCKDSSTFTCENSNVTLSTDTRQISFYTDQQLGKNCMLVRGGVLDSFQKKGGYLTFDNCFTTPSIATGNLSRTISYWIKYPSDYHSYYGPVDEQLIWGYGTNSTNNNLICQTSKGVRLSGTVIINSTTRNTEHIYEDGTYIVGNNDQITPSTNFSLDNQWHLITVTYDGTSRLYNCYLDLLLVFSKQLNTDLATDSTYPLTIGVNLANPLRTSLNYGQPSFRISDFRLWNRALTSNELIDLYWYN